MTARDLLRRTPLRLAGAFAALFATTVIALFTVFYLGISARLDNQVHVQIEEAMDALVSVDDQRNFDDLATVVKSESASVRDSDFIYELVDETGQRIAGNIHGVASSPDVLVMKRSDIRLTSGKGKPDDLFYAVWKPVSKGRLLVGASNREVRQTQEFLWRVFGYGLVLTMIAVGLCGAYLARQAQHRIEAFATTLSGVSRGQIGARVPMTGSGDDIDRVGGQINRTLDHLQKLIENVNQSSSDIAHDLKKPIGRLRQRLDTARRAPAGVEDVNAVLDDALSDIDSTMETFDALLRITQIEAGARKDRFAELDLMAVLDDVGDVYAVVAEDAGHSFTHTDGATGPALVRGDRELLVQLFANLVENAIRHCPPDARIAVRIRELDDTYIFEVKDHGPGIPELERGNVFRRLYRLETARSTAGTGLGLSLAAAIVDLHDASIDLSDNNPGLCVAITFSKSAA